MAPLWKTQPWCPLGYPLLLQLLSGFPLLSDSDTGRHSIISDSERVHNASGARSGVPQLVVWPLSGIVAEQEAFQRELQCYWSQQGGTKLSLPMSHSSNGAWDCWCKERGRNPIRGSLVDILNFLVDLFKEGYEYR